ncbi:MAG: YicC family protein [Thermotogae bacterium]|nr:YicC family protein [Thermotogota bacterium]
MFVRSMTGYSILNENIDDFEYSVEIKSLNSRYLQINVSIPRYISILEVYISNILKNRINRGKIQVKLNIKIPKNFELLKLDRGMVQNYLKILEELAKIANYDQKITIQDLLSLGTDIFTFNITEEFLSKIKEHLQNLLNKAIDRLDRVRIEEGTKLKDDLLKYLMELENTISFIESLSNTQKDYYREKLKNNLKESGILEKVDQDRLEQEIALLVEKADISEEITRLKIHIGKFRDLLDSGGAIGNMLDFLSQEILRELNTIGSKSKLSQISVFVVEGKNLINKIREQVQNIE